MTSARAATRGPGTRSARARRSTRARPSDDELLDAALGVFADHGFRSTTMSAVAERCNSTKPTLYAHFGDKDALYTRLLRREADTCRATLFDAYEASSGLGLGDQVAADTNALFAYAAAHPQGFALLFGHDITSTATEIREQLRLEVREQVTRRVHDYLRRTGATVRRRPGNDEAQLAAMLVGVAVSAAEQALAGHADLGQACRLATAFSTAALTGLTRGEPRRRLDTTTPASDLARRDV